MCIWETILDDISQINMCEDEVYKMNVHLNDNVK